MVGIVESVDEHLTIIEVLYWTCIHGVRILRLESSDDTSIHVCRRGHYKPLHTLAAWWRCQGSCIAPVVSIEYCLESIEVNWIRQRSGCICVWHGCQAEVKEELPLQLAIITTFLRELQENTDDGSVFTSMRPRPLVVNLQLSDKSVPMDQML
jgi:hypothetical protein